MSHDRCLRALWMSSLWMLSLLLAFSGALTAAEPAIPRDFIHNQQRFAFELYQQLGRHSQGNLCFAPGSIQMALAMTYAGARGETARQMAEVLHFDLPANELHIAFGELQHQLNLSDRASGLQISVANRLWGQRGYAFVPAFLELTAKRYGAELGQVDFRGEPEAAQAKINAWVADETSNKIPALLGEGSVSGQTRLVLTNALYFLGEWTYPFNEKATEKAPFYRADGDSSDTLLMKQTERLRYASFNGIQALELPYRGDRFSLLVLLPEKRDGLKALEESLGAKLIADFVSQLRYHRVQVFLPQFKTLARFELADTLAAMGMTLPFSSSADFSGISTSEDVFISAVIHEAYVDVNSKGTEAAAATAVVADGAPAPPSEPIVFRADHPFVYVIRDNRTGGMLFVGRMAEPTR